MELTEQHRKVLGELSKINAQVWFSSDTLCLKDNEGTMAAFYNWGVKLKKEFGIYDLPTVLSTLKIYKDDQNLKVEEGISENTLTISCGSMKTVHRCTDKKNISTPQPKEFYIKVLEDPKDFIEISADVFMAIKEHAGAIKVPQIVFEGNKITAIDIDGTMEDNFVYELDKSVNMTRLPILTENFMKIINASYRIRNNGVLAEFCDTNGLVTYYVAGAQEKKDQ
jgi:hypothetical protein